MGLLWITEALPVPITALVPVVAFPLLGVAPASEISEVYLSVKSCLLVLKTFIFLRTRILSSLDLWSWRLL